METNRNNINIIFQDSSGKLISAVFDYFKLYSPRELNQPLKLHQPDQGRTEVMGSCNGLLCLVNENKKLNESNQSYWTLMSITLWNITTEDYKVLPLDVPRPGSQFELTFYGFGHDWINDDYKVVKIVELQLPDKHIGKEKVYSISEVKVYSLKTNTWRRVTEEVPNCFIRDHPRCWRMGGRFIRGALHWFVQRNQPESPDFRCCILAFDVETEKYDEIELPDGMKNLPEDNWRDTKFLGTLQGCLCVFSSGRDHYIWLMKDYGVKESWTLIYRDDGGYHYSCFSPLAYYKNYDKILFTSFWYHIKNDEVGCFSRYFDTFHFHDSEICIESLVQPSNW
ncbi:hypothetical protein PTKIN_Ptkin03bG0009600 [Pterospermum kingtungense]